MQRTKPRSAMDSEYLRDFCHDSHGIAWGHSYSQIAETSQAPVWCVECQGTCCYCSYWWQGSMSMKWFGPVIDLIGSHVKLPNANMSSNTAMSQSIDISFLILSLDSDQCWAWCFTIIGRYNLAAIQVPMASFMKSPMIAWNLNHSQLQTQRPVHLTKTTTVGKRNREVMKAGSYFFTVYLIDTLWLAIPLRCNCLWIMSGGCIGWFSNQN